MYIIPINILELKLHDHLAWNFNDTGTLLHLYLPYNIYIWYDMIWYAIKNNGNMNNNNIWYDEDDEEEVQEIIIIIRFLLILICNQNTTTTATSCIWIVMIIAISNLLYRKSSFLIVSLL